MTELIRQEINLGNGRTRIRFVPASPRVEPRRAVGLACPMVVRSFSEPVQSMADGKWYDTPADLRKSYKAENNPAGVDYIELGNEDIKPDEGPVQTRAELRDEIKQAINMVDQGWNPQSTYIDDL